MTVTDRGGNTATISQQVEVLQANGQPPSTGGNQGGGGSTKFRVGLQLLPQSLGSVLRSGLAVRVTSNRAASGFATLSIFRKAAHQAHLASAGNPNSMVVIGRGTVSAVKHGTVLFHVHVSSATAHKLAHTSHLTLTPSPDAVRQGRRPDDRRPPSGATRYLARPPAGPERGGRP